MCVHVCAHACICVCMHVHMCRLHCINCLSEQLKEPWDYENIQERIAEADNIKQRGTMFFKVIPLR